MANTVVPPPALADEPARLEALHRLTLLDTPPDERFNLVVQFAAKELDVPISVVSLVDEHRVWFKAKLGLPVNETPRDISLCAHAIASDSPFVVEDTQLDVQLCGNPLVTGPPHIRFYAGAPIKAPAGERVGSVCVVDTKPRVANSMDLAILNALCDLVSEMLTVRDQPAAPASVTPANAQPALTPDQVRMLIRARDGLSLWKLGQPLQQAARDVIALRARQLICDPGYRITPAGLSCLDGAARSA